MAMAMVPVGRAPVYIPASSPFKSSYTSRAGLAMSSFVSHSALSSAQAFSGMSLGLFNKTSSQQCEKRGYRLIVRAGKTSMACTKRSRSRKSRARAQGFRARMATPGGRNVLRRRRRKGRKVLVPQSNPNSGKRA